MTMDLQGHKKRLMAMLAVNAVCALVALAALFGDFRYGVDWLSGVFIAALVVGIAAQLWFVSGFRRRGS